MISSLPRRDPEELKSFASTPRSCRYRAAGELLAILPAGEMWSVVIESPTFRSAYALLMSLTAGGSIVMSWKNGGLWMYVDLSSQVNVSPLGAFNSFQRLLPLATFLYVSRNISGCTTSFSILRISSFVGQMSLRKTGPSTPVPIGSVSKSMSQRPARAYATTRGGLAR